jgi:hypothetical protein
MTLSTNRWIAIVTIIANTLGWIATSNFELLPESFMKYFTFGSLLLAFILAQIAHFFNTDGTSQAAPFIKKF